ncbi:MAG: metal-dependent transcriptional regulator [Methanomassiliicoccales archaeon]|nr:metal-dependent transcriptional regulator [Methanomassiliicoccales archaeon]NYT15866.1 metal-dependent transcriptional regulator [Methanomassiliicoccales archaeon]
MRRSSVEQYLKTIKSLQERNDRVCTSLIAKRLGIRPSSVSEFCRKLNNKGYIAWKPYQGARLTERGKEIATRVEQRYQAILRFLILLGVEEDEAIIQACRLEHEISDDSAERLQNLIGKIDLVLPPKY